VEPSGRNRWQSAANGISAKPRKWAKTIAMGCDGKEGVDGSSPSEGFAIQPAISAFLLSALTLVCCLGVHATSTSVHGSVR
jgi:hypothetical protein